jgi:hypothetical protein
MYKAVVVITSSAFPSENLFYNFKKSSGAAKRRANKEKQKLERDVAKIARLNSYFKQTLVTQLTQASQGTTSIPFPRVDFLSSNAEHSTIDALLPLFSRGNSINIINER